MLSDHKHIEITDSNSKLSFTTTGGDNWKVWDRYISYDNEQLYHIGNVCGTCAFFFRQVKTDLTGSYTVDSVREILNSGINRLDDSLLQSLAAIIPNGAYECILLEIQPYQTCFNGKGDYFKEDQAPLWYYGGDDDTVGTGMSYYRGTDRVISKQEKLFEFFIPLYQPSSLNEERIKYYREQIRKGRKPTAIALSVIDAKESMIFDEEPADGIICHWGFANYLLDGHHKIQAAAREHQPITLISFISKDASFRIVDDLVNFYKKSNNENDDTR